MQSEFDIKILLRKLEGEIVQVVDRLVDPRKSWQSQRVRREVRNTDTLDGGRGRDGASSWLMSRFTVREF